MAKDSILLGEVAARGARMLVLRCGRCNRHGRLSVARLLAEYGADAVMGPIMRAQIGDCRKRDATQVYERCDPYRPTLAQLFGTPEPGYWRGLWRQFRCKQRDQEGSCLKDTWLLS